MSEEKVTGYVSKYALTTGITVVEGTVTGSGAFCTRQRGYYQYFSSANDWARTHEEAVAQAEKLRTRKLASLQKQIKRIHELDFSELKA